MRVAVVGVGHVGLVTAACLARWGHEVVGVDDDETRVGQLRSGVMPFHEPGLDALVAEGRRAGRLDFSADLASGLAGATVAFVCVGTPSLPDGSADLRYVEAVARQAARLASNDLVLVEKSTVPAQTGQRMMAVIGQEQAVQGGGHEVLVASNPEFLREGTAVKDTLHPERVVVGTTGQRALEVLRGVYRPLLEVGVPIVETDLATAELIKHASNAFLATKISFANALARICETVGADVEMVTTGMGLDSRIGPSFLRAGLGYGGSCFPKDVEAFIHLCGELGYDFGMLEEVRRINDEPRERVIELLCGELWHLAGKTIVLLGAAYKPHTDDLREAPALKLAEQLLEQGAHVRIYDPVALPGVTDAVPKASTYHDPLEACRTAAAAVVCTEWPQIAELSPDQLRDALDYPVLIDARNVFDADQMRAAGIRYHRLGRPSAV